MHVAHGARDFARGLFQDFRKLRGVKIAIRTYLDLRIAALRDQWRKPADLQLQSHDYQQICVAQLEQEAGLGFHKVRILISLGNRLDGHLITADFLGKSRPVGRRGDHIDLLG